ncbi:MAG: M48 family metalloprotease [Candidatus Marinimicrobia bacterium]|nr:M48 family metalloprotease [Candidatus Neomarinimicrobiota bacterium]
MRKLTIVVFVVILIIIIFGASLSKIIRNNIHLREGPGCFYPVQAVLNQGAEVEVLDKNEQWLKVKCKDEIGWITDLALESGLKEDSIFEQSIGSPSDQEVISQASVSAAVRGFALRYLESFGGDTSFIQNYNKRLFTQEEYLNFKRETYQNRNSKKIRKRYKKWRRFKYNKDYHIDKELEKIGLAVASRIAVQGLIVDDGKSKYINKLGTLIAENSELYYFPIKFYLLNDKRPAAYATPIGMIFITEGLLDMVASEAELACLLGHEIGHVVRQHGYSEIKKRQPRIAAQKAFNELNEEIPGTDSTAMELSKLANKMYEASIAKRQLKYEYQADKCGIVYAYRAGYDPQSLTDLLARIKNNSNTNYENFESNWEAYYIKDRIRKVKKIIDDLDLDKNLYVKNRYRFEKNIK